MHEIVSREYRVAGSSNPTDRDNRVARAADRVSQFEFTRSLRAAFNNAGRAGAFEILSIPGIPPGVINHEFLFQSTERTPRRRTGSWMKMFRVETATTTEFSHAAESGLLTELRVTECTCCYTAEPHVHARARARAVYARSARTKRERKAHFQFVPVYLKNGERNLRLRSGPASYRACCESAIASEKRERERENCSRVSFHSEILRRDQSTMNDGIHAGKCVNSLSLSLSLFVPSFLSFQSLSCRCSRRAVVFVAFHGTRYTKAASTVAFTLTRGI